MSCPETVRAELEEWHPASYAWALSCCGYDRAEADEVLQSAYLKVLDGRAVYGGRALFRTWLFSVIRLTAADRRRWRFLRGRRTPALSGYTEPAAEEIDPGLSLDSRERAKRLGRALAKLPARQREVLHLVFYEDLSIAEAAAVLELTVGSARTHYERGKKRLRQLLEEIECDKTNPASSVPGLTR